MEQVAQFLGFWVMALAGVSVVLSVTWIVAGEFGERVFNRLRRIYHLRLISYWLDRLEREGKRTFQRPDEGA
jgi:hypothetical protein